MADTTAAAPSAAQTTESTTAPASKTDAAAPQSGWEQMAFIIVLWVGVIYFFFIRPQKRKEKARKDRLESLKKGDEVRTIGGIYGTVASLKDERVTLKVDKKSGQTIEIARGAVSAIVNGEEEESLETK